MKRLFYTDEKVDNRLFQRFLGFQPSYGRGLLDEEQSLFTVFLDGRYIEKEIRTQQSERRVEKVLLDEKITTLLSTYIQTGDVLMLEKSMSHGVVEKLHYSALDVQWSFDEEQWQKNMRITKSSDEIVHIQQAIAHTEDIWAWIKGLAMEGALLGKTELEVRGMLIQQAYSLGLEGEAFATIVASGANSAIPHHTSGRTIIEPGPLLIDMGFRREGWCSDFTRVLWVPKDIPSPPIPQGTISPDDVGIHLVPEGEEIRGELDYQEHHAFQEVLDIVQQAHDVAREMVAPGVLFKELALAARKVIEDAGYGDYFAHSLGHGVGLDVHEAPSVSKKSEDIIASGMVFTIEPGIYLAGKFGVRWENMVIVD